MTVLYWVETGTQGRVAIMASPRSGEGFVDEMRRAGVDLVVSLLTQDEVSELGLEGAQSACLAAGLELRDFPIRDRQVPAVNSATIAFIAALKDEVLAGRSIVIHCRMGIGRSSLIAASVLGLLGVLPSEALARLSASRGLSVPDTEAQRQWIIHFTW